LKMKGGLNKLMRNITATAEGKSDFEKVTKYKHYESNKYRDSLRLHIITIPKSLKKSM